MFSLPSVGNNCKSSSYDPSSAALTLSMTLHNVARAMVTPTTSRRNFRIVEYEAWQKPFMKAIRAVRFGPTKPPRSIGNGSGAQHGLRQWLHQYSGQLCCSMVSGVASIRFVAPRVDKARCDAV